MVGRDNRYLPESAQWGKLLVELKQMALSGELPEQIATRLMEARRQLMG